MTCEECKDLLVQHSLDTIDESGRAQVRAHLADCADCAEYLTGLQKTLSLLPLSVPPQAPPAGARVRLMERIASAPRPVVVAQPVAAQLRPTFRFRRFIEALAAGAMAAIVTAAVFWIVLDHQRVSIAMLRQELDQTERALKQLQDSVRNTNESIQLLQSPGVQLVSLEGTASQPRARARVFWDTARGAWHFYAADLKPSAPGKTYELWLINSDQKKFAAGTFNVNEHGEANLIAEAAPDTGRVVALAVTDEPTGGVQQPTGQIQLLGQIK